MVNTRQRFEAWRFAKARLAPYRGSMVWSPTKGIDYLLRSSYSAAGKRVQRSLGPRCDVTEAQKRQFDDGRAQAQARMEAIQTIMIRQAAINRAIGLGRVPLLSAKIIRAVDNAGLLGNGLQIVGTHALYAYEAMASAIFDASITTTEDIDFLKDARASLGFSVTASLRGVSLLGLLKSIDASFERAPQPYRAINGAGFFVDLIAPLPDPPWKTGTAPADATDLQAIEIEGLAWLENAPSFEAIAIDVQGNPCRIIAVDPRVFAAHKSWLSRRPDRDPGKRLRDLAQARAVAALTIRHFPHLPYESGDLRMLPLALFEHARPLFASVPGSDVFL